MIIFSRYQKLYAAIVVAGFCALFVAAPARAETSLKQDLAYWESYQKSDTRASFRNLAHFSERRPDWPHMGRIHQNAERALLRERKNLPEHIMRQWFAEHAPVSPQALLLAASLMDISNQVPKWWRQTAMRPEDQREILSRFGHLLGPDDHVARLKMTLSRDQYSAARDLADILKGGWPAYVEGRIALQTNAADVNARVRAVPAGLQAEKEFILDRLIWRRRYAEPAHAIALFSFFKTQHNDYDIWHQRHIMARDFLEKRQFKEAYDLVRGHQQTGGLGFAQAEFLAGWIALRFLEDAETARRHFERLYQNVSTPISRSRGAYWTGRAYARLNQPEQARVWYEKAAVFPVTFYGQQARSLINARMPLILETQAQDPAAQASASALATRSDLAAALAELLRQERYDLARHFENRLLTLAQREADFRQLAEIARRLDAPYLGVQAARKAAQQQIFLPRDMAYPVLPSAASLNVDRQLVHAIIRQESAFDRHAVSHAGARGLMQLMPATAKATAHRMNLIYQQGKLTKDPAYNVRLGQAYLDELLDRFDQNIIFTVAGYNAGPSRVDRWREIYGDPAAGEIDWLDWIELIPIYETRNYVQRVVEMYFIYRERLRG